MPACGRNVRQDALPIKLIYWSFRLAKGQYLNMNWLRLPLDRLLNMPSRGANALDAV